MTRTDLHHRKILVIDDEPDLRTLYELTLLREGYHVVAAGCIQEAWQLLAAQQFALVITDMRLPDGLGVNLLKDMQAQRRSEICIVITAYGSAENAVESLKAGAFDYLTKPVDLQQFRAVVASALGTTPATAASTAQAQPTLAQPAHSAAPSAAHNTAQTALARIVGQAPSMHAVRERIAKVAPSMAPVLVHGESGTGKELVAQALHASSHRVKGPWVAVNCGAIPENLLEAEFFGAKKGAYTGATQDRLGFFQSAHGGTLFLDEIGDLPLAMQAKLLRAIQERRVRPLGAQQEDAVDVRIVSASHKDLAAEVTAGRFRQDLFYRLNVIDITIPPLRERREDIPLLCSTLLQRIAHDAGVAMPQLSAEVLAPLDTLPLHGNVRELENILHRAMALYEEGQPLALHSIGLYNSATPLAAAHAAVQESLPPPYASPSTARAEAIASTTPPTESPLPRDLQQHLDQQERDILLRALQETRFNRTSAAKLLGLTLRQIRYRITRLNIPTPAEPTEPTGPNDEVHDA